MAPLPLRTLLRAGRSTKQSQGGSENLGEVLSFWLALWPLKATLWAPGVGARGIGPPAGNLHEQYANRHSAWLVPHLRKEGNTRSACSLETPPTLSLESGASPVFHCLLPRACSHAKQLTQGDAHSFLIPLASMGARPWEQVLHPAVCIPGQVLGSARSAMC